MTGGVGLDVRCRFVRQLDVVDDTQNLVVQTGTSMLGNVVVPGTITNTEFGHDGFRLVRADVSFWCGHTIVDGDPDWESGDLDVVLTFKQTFPQVARSKGRRGFWRNREKVLWPKNGEVLKLGHRNLYRREIALDIADISDDLG